MPSSVPRIVGRWFAASQILNVGRNVKNSANISRAVTGSPPLSSFTSDSANAWPCSASLADTKRAPRRIATSFRRSSPWSLTISVDAFVLAA